MDDLKFVLRSLMFASLILLGSQYKIENETLEHKAQIFLQESSTAYYLRETAAGGVKFIQEQINKANDFISNKKNREAGGRHRDFENRH